MMVQFRTRWVVSLLLAVLATGAIAQETESQGDPDAISFRVEFGFGNEITPNRWNPVRVWISSGSRSAQGVVELRYKTDPTQEHRVVAPFTTTPGKIIPVDLLICPYEQTHAITLAIIPERGRRPKTVRFETQSWRSGGQNVVLRDLNKAVALSIGETGIRHATTTLRSRAALESRPEEGIQIPTSESDPLTSEQLWNSNAEVVQIQVGQEPVHWAAYDAVRVVIVRSNDAELLAPGALEQIKLWTRSGGRLVLLVDARGSSWLGWFDGDFRSPPIRLSPPEQRPLPQDVVDYFDDLSEDLPETLAPEPAQTIPARRIALTRLGIAHGWRLSWLDQTHTDESPSGFLAEGPMGFGVVTVLGIDPGRASSVLSSLATGLIWQQAVQRSMLDWQSEVQRVSRTNTGWGMPTSISGMANSEVISLFVDFEPASNFAFVLITLGILTLAMLLGPFDALVLKRFRQRHRSWMTALMWITIFGGVAYVAPRIIRSGPSRVRQMQIIDAIQPITQASAPLTANTEIFGIFANRSGLAALAPSIPTSLTSGVSALSGMFGQTPGISGTFRTVQQLTRRSDDALPSGSPLSQIQLNVWTFRTFLSRSPPVGTDALIKANVVRADGRWSIELEGIPPSAQVNRVLLHTASGYYTVEQSAPNQATLDDDPSPWNGVAESEGQSRPTAAWGSSADSIDQLPVWNSWSVPEFHPHSALAVAGPDRRGLSIRRRVQSGRWACVYIEVSNLPPTLAIEGWTVQGQRYAVLRILVPLADADALDPSPSFVRFERD